MVIPPSKALALSSINYYSILPFLTISLYDRGSRNDRIFIFYLSDTPILLTKFLFILQKNFGEPAKILRQALSLPENLLKKGLQQVSSLSNSDDNYPLTQQLTRHRPETISLYWLHLIKRNCRKMYFLPIRTNSDTTNESNPGIVPLFQGAL